MQHRFHELRFGAAETGGEQFVKLPNALAGLACRVDISFDEIEKHLGEDLSLFHTGSLAITPSQLPKIRRLFELLQSRGVLISVDINIRHRASIDTKAYLEGVQSLFDAADIVKASDDDLAAFKMDANPRKAAEIAYAAMGSGLLVLTEGRGGAVLINERGTIEKVAYPIARLEDTVGAGDTFHSAFLAALLRTGKVEGSLESVSQDSLGDAVDFACAAAAINVSRAGCSPPTKTEVEKYIESTQR